MLTMDVPLCVTYDGFHKSIPCIDYTFDDEKGFFTEMDKIIAKHTERLNFFENNSPTNYAQWILGVWKGNITQNLTDDDTKCLSYSSVLEKKREHYFLLTKGGIKRFITRRIMQYKQRRDQKNQNV